MYSQKELQNIFKSALENQDFAFHPRELYEPLSYILSLGGKRLRPLLVLMSCDMFEGNADEALAPAIAIELFHNFTLMHDDIMDQAPLRRGMPTVHHKYNTNIAILSGDVMLVYAYQYLLKVKKEILKDVLRVFNDTAIRVCEGQQLDMNYESQQATIDQYLKMIELKTATLIGGSLKIGALIADASEKDSQLIYDFGKHIGIAFQLQDDILDTFGDGGKVGKQVGGDIVQNKKTFLYLKALELAGEGTRNRLKQLYSEMTADSQKKVEEVIALFHQLKVLEHAEKLKQHYLSAALSFLNAATPSSDRKEEIKKLALHLLHRES